MTAPRDLLLEDWGAAPDTLREALDLLDRLRAALAASRGRSRGAATLH